LYRLQGNANIGANTVIDVNGWVGGIYSVMVGVLSVCLNKEKNNE